MNNDIISISAAIEAAAKYAGFSVEDIRCTKKEYGSGLFQICFATDWSVYDCYIDALSAEVVGFSSEPYVDSDYIFAQDSGASWKYNIAASK